MTSETSELFAKQLPVDELDDLRGLGRRAPRRGGYGGAHVEERLEPAEIPDVPVFFRQHRPGDAVDGEVVAEPNHRLGRIRVTADAVGIEEVTLLCVGDDVNDLPDAVVRSTAVDKLRRGTPLCSLLGCGGF